MSGEVESRRARWLRALERLERWADARARHSHEDPEWRDRRLRVQASPSRDFAAESLELLIWEVEGAESAYADAAARLAHLRAQLEVEPDGRDVRQLIARAVDAELVWVAAAHREAVAARGDASSLDPEEIHAQGRVTALEAIGAELQDLAEGAAPDAPRAS